MCSKHREPGHHLCLPRTVIRAAARDPPQTPCLRDICLGGWGAGRDGVSFILYEFPGYYKYLRGLHRKISQKKAKNKSGFS